MRRTIGCQAHIELCICKSGKSAVRNILASEFFDGPDIFLATVAKQPPIDTLVEQ